MTSMDRSLYKGWITSSTFGTAALFALIFIPAGTIHYWQGWALTRRPVFEFNDIRHASSDRKSLRLSYFLRFELLDERSDMRRYGGRESVVLGLEAVPNGQPNASFASGNQLALRSTLKLNCQS